MKDYALNTGTVLHGPNYDYTIERVLGNGTFGITYLAKVKMKGSLGSLDAKLNVAIKEFFMRDFNGREGSSVTYSSKDGAFTYYKSKFIHEAENLSKLHSPGIVNVLELFEANQTAYYVMDYLPNGSLDEYIKAKRPLPLKICIDYAIQISEALKYMHDNQMLHLDLKPGNIMINNHDRLVLIDFGLSKRFDLWGNPETSTTIGHGTPGYAPVEQAHYQGNRNEGLPASMDIYALGATIFKMLTGQRPPEASIILNEGFPTDELVSVNTPVELIDVVHTCMEPMRKNRYKSMKEVIVALSTIPQMDEDSEWTELKQDNGQTKGQQRKGYYKKAFGEKEYGTYEVKMVPVTSSIKFPDSIRIKLYDNSKNRESYELYLTDVFPSDGDISLQNYIRCWKKGELIYEDLWYVGIPSDVKEYIIKNGLLSTEHWEREDSTTITKPDFGTDVSIIMSNRKGEIFTRRVQHAHKNRHALLLDTVWGLLNETSLSEFFHKAQNAKREKERGEQNNEDNAILDSEVSDRSDSLSKNKEPITIIDFLVTIGNIAMGLYFLCEVFSLSFWPYLIMPVIVYMYKQPKYKHYYKSSSSIAISMFLQWMMTWDIDYSILRIDSTWGFVGTSILLFLLNAILIGAFGKWGCAFITFATTIALFFRS